MTTIIKADLGHLHQIVPLFDKYRIFYQQASDQVAATKFLEERISKKESVVFLALEDNIPIGFTQLYATFSSVSMKATYVLNDLYVDKEHRSKGVGEALLNHAKAFCKEMRYKGLALETAVDNPAQHLYEKLGWKKDTDCFHYFWTCE